MLLLNSNFILNHTASSASITRAYIGSPESNFSKLFIPKLLELGPCMLVFILQKPYVLSPKNSSFLLKQVLNIKQWNFYSIAGIWYWYFYSQWHKVPMQTFHSVNDPKLINLLKDKEFILSAGLNEKVLPPILNACPNGIVNFHYSLLPNFRDRFPIFWQFVQNDLNFGYSFHKMGTNLDNGTIVLQKKITISKKAFLAKNPIASISDELSLHASNQIHALIYAKSFQKVPNESAHLYTSKEFSDFHRIYLSNSGEKWSKTCQFSELLILEDRYIIHVKESDASSIQKSQLRMIGKSILITKDCRNFIIRKINYLPAAFFYFQLKHIANTR